MKDNPKDPECLYSTWTSTKVTICFLLLISVSYISYSLKYIHPYLCTQQSQSTYFQSQLSIPLSHPNPQTQKPEEPKTNISHIVFGIAASADLWPHRKNYIKLWWRPDQMRGNVWLDQPVKTEPKSDHTLLPPLRISGDTSDFKYTNPKGHRSAIRISRIVSESFRLGMENVRWFVLGDDDTVFVAENLVRVLQKYDHNQFYYIGGSSESHLQNIYFSYNMAYGGGGIAISYPLAKALEKMQDRCIQRYPGLYGSDDRLQACMAEIGVPLTKEKGFHQFDVYGSLFGLLAAHPVASLVSLHHLDVVEPLFPNMDRIHALERLKVPMKLDSAGLAQQSICYDINRSWTVSISWGYAVQIFRGISSAREMELPALTFLNWYKKADHTAYPFNTRPVHRHRCQEPFVYYLSNANYNRSTNQTVTEYVRYQTGKPECNWKMANPSRIHKIHVHKTPDPHLWDKSPRRNCCKILRPDSKKKGTMVIEVGVCHEDEVVEVWECRWRRLRLAAAVFIPGHVRYLDGYKERQGSLGWFSSGVLRGLASGDLGSLNTGMVWGDLCSVAARGRFGIMISVVSIHGRGLWDPFRRVWDLGFALVMRGGCGLDSEIGVGDAFAAWSFISV